MGMHLSGVVGLVACLEAATAVALRKVLPPPIQFLLWNLTATATIISISATDQLAPHSTWILGKRRRDGRILPRGWLLWAYHAGIRIKLRLQRIITNENVYDGIFEKMYLGGWPSNAREAPQVDKLAVVDVTCELPLKIAAKAYLMVPVWDTHSPSVEQIEMASAWAAQRVEEGYSVLVHCAHGHGRSATVMGAILIRQGIADSVDDAEKIMKKSRPRVRLNARQRKGLGAWYVRFYAKRR